jgi:hypothetical protein
MKLKPSTAQNLDTIKEYMDQTYNYRQSQISAAELKDGTSFLEAYPRYKHCENGSLVMEYFHS